MITCQISRGGKNLINVMIRGLAFIMVSFVIMSTDIIPAEAAVAKGVSINKDQVAKQDNAAASRYMQVGSDFYFGDNGRQQDYAMSMNNYKVAAYMGDADAMFMLGHMYENAFTLGLGMPDYELAEYWYLQSAESGSTDAMVALGDMYFLGREENRQEKALHWYEKAAYLGNTQGMIWAGILNVREEAEADQEYH